MAADSGGCSNPKLCTYKSAHAAAPSPTFPPYVSPEVNSDHTVTFRLRAPNAQKVEIVLEGAATPMQQGADGLWTAASPVLAPEIYSYHFVIDGTSFLDPRNTHVVHNLLNLASDVTVPATPPEPWEPREVPHGVVERRFYTSQVVLGLPNNRMILHLHAAGLQPEIPSELSCAISSPRL